MPLYRDRIAKELEDKKTDFDGVGFDKAVLDQFREAAEEFSSDIETEIVDKLETLQYPGAVPTEEFLEEEKWIIPFKESDSWNSHEAVNNWSRSQLENVTTIAADGSQIDPVEEFEKPVGLVQVVTIANDHTKTGDYEEDAIVEVLTPEDILYSDEDGRKQIDDQEVDTKRFETEMRVLEKQIEEFSDREQPPVVIYDGSLLLSFTGKFDGEIQGRYAEAMSRLLAASRYHGVPVVGYVSGSVATDLTKMLDNLNLVNTGQTVRDYQMLRAFTENWGDRTALFKSRRDDTLETLHTTYQGEDFDFSDKLLFTYLDVGSGPQMDRIELPQWVVEEDLFDYVISVIRGEAGVGRGYPEILQSVDADAVISRQDRQQFLRMYQEFSNENDIELQWNNKALSKNRRRR